METMSDEESFVILGSSPTPSLEQDGINGRASSINSSLRSDSRFSSLKNSQINELESARQISTQTPTPEKPTPLPRQNIVATVMEQTLANSAVMEQTLAPSVLQQSLAPSVLEQSLANSVVMEQSAESNLWFRPQVEQSLATSVKRQSAESKLWSRPQVEVQDDFVPISLNDCALKSLPEQSLKDIEIEKENHKDSLRTQNSLNTNGIKSTSKKTSPLTSVNNNLHSSFITGEVNFVPISLDDCALKSPLEQSLNDMEIEKENHKGSLTIIAPSSLNTIQNSLNTNNNIKSTSNKTSSLTSVNTNLASSFIMGEVNGDILKTSVYSQFPSISMDASAEDVVKLQNMVTEYMELKTTLDKVNNTMKLFYTNSMQWKEKMNQMENQYKQQLNECQQQIEMLRKENQELKLSFESQVEQTKALDVARQKDREETIQELSEKTALLENLRAQIVKLEQQEMATFEFIPKKPTNFDQLYVTRGEHELKIKQLERQLSEVLASNLDMKDVEKQYLEELNCLKVNLTSAEELIQEHRAEIAELRALDMNKKKKIEELETSNTQLHLTNLQQNERILVLEQQNQVHRKDFEMEREGRQTVVGEKQQILQDLRALQKKNQDLIEERQKLVETYEKRKSSASSVGCSPSFVAAAAAAQNYIDNPQRPIRDLPTAPNSQSVSPPASVYRCPICNKSFKSLNVLQSHVNDCIDKN